MFQFLFLLSALAAAAFAEDSTHVLLKPDTAVPVVRIGRAEFVRAEIYLDKTADPKILVPFGFREVRFVASATHYNRYQTLLPHNVEPDSLPRAVQAIYYDYTPVPGSNMAVTTPDCGYEVVGDRIVFLGPDGNPYHKFGQTFPDKSDTIVLGLPYIKGLIYLISLDDTAKIRSLGFTPFVVPWWERVSQPDQDPTLREYVAHYDRYLHESTSKELKIFETCYPLDLNTDDLPQSVIELISNRVADEASDRFEKTKTSPQNSQH